MYLKNDSSLIDKKDIVCIYHYGCIDGVLSAALIYHVFNDVDFIKGYHNENIDFYNSYVEKCKGKNVYIVDYVPPKSVLIEIASVCKTLVVLDHHADKSYAYDVVKINKDKIYVEMDNRRSGVKLVWDFINKYKLNNFKHHKGIEKIVCDMSLYDLWMHEGRCKIESIAFFLKGFASNSPKYVSKVVFENCNIDAFYKSGKIISDLYFSKIKRYKYDFNVSDASYKFDNKIKRGLVVHNYDEYYFNELTRYLLKNKHISFVIGTNEKKDKIGLSIRSNDGSSAFNIASSYGGGGHADAAGTVISGEDFRNLQERYIFNF